MWQIDLAVKIAKSLLPFQGGLRAFKRKWIPCKCDIENAEFALHQGLEQIAVLRRCGFSFEDRSVLDLGSGWFPIVPLLVRVAGGQLVHLSDVEHLLDRKTLLASARFLCARSANIATALGVSTHHVESTLALPEGSFDDLMRWLGLTYLVPFDSCLMPSVDLIMSRAVLEHIPPFTIVKMFADFRDHLRKGGMMSHVIDHSDHREHRDKSLSRIDFLRYNETIWRLLTTNPQDYTNRLRHTEYHELIVKAGYEILFEDREIDARAVEDAKWLPLAARFRNMRPEELGIITSHFVARPR